MINRIALIDETGRLCTCNPDGSEYRILTRRDRLYQFPCWSPNGRYIAAIGSDRAGAGIYLFSDEQYGEQWQLYRSLVGTRQSPFYLYWSPDSQYVGFIANNPVGGIGFFTVTATQRPQVKLIAMGQPFFWQWGTQSNELFLHSGVGESGRLQLINPHDEAPEMPNHAMPGYFQTPGISNDGSYLTYATLDEDEKTRIIIEDRETERIVSHPHSGAVALSWSPTRNQLAFMAPQNTTTHFFGPLSLMDLQGEVRRITGEPILAFFWSPDGDKIAYFSPTRIQTFNRFVGGSGVTYLNGHNPPQMLSSNRQELIQMELWIIDLVANNRQKLFHFQPTRLFLNQFLPFFDQYALSHRIWSPNSDAIVLPILQDGKNRVVNIALNGSLPVLLGEGLFGSWSQS